MLCHMDFRWRELIAVKHPLSVYFLIFHHLSIGNPVIQSADIHRCIRYFVCGRKVGVISEYIEPEGKQNCQCRNGTEGKLLLMGKQFSKIKMINAFDHTVRDHASADHTKDHPAVGALQGPEKIPYAHSDDRLAHCKGHSLSCRLRRALFVKEDCCSYQEQRHDQRCRRHHSHRLLICVERYRMNILHDRGNPDQIFKHRIVTRIIIGQKKALKKGFKQAGCDRHIKHQHHAAKKADHKMTGHQGRDHHGCVAKDVVDHVQYIGTYSCCAQSIRAHTVCRAHDHRSNKSKCVRNGRHQDAVCIVDQEQDLPPYRYAMIKIHTFSGG